MWNLKGKNCMKFKKFIIYNVLLVKTYCLESKSASCVFAHVFDIVCIRLEEKVLIGRVTSNY